MNTTRSTRMKQLWANPTWRRRQLRKLRTRLSSPKHRERMLKLQRSTWYRQKMRELSRSRWTESYRAERAATLRKEQEARELERRHVSSMSDDEVREWQLLSISSYSVPHTNTKKR